MQVAKDIAKAQTFELREQAADMRLGAFEGVDFHDQRIDARERVAAVLEQREFGAFDIKLQEVDGRFAQHCLQAHRRHFRRAGGFGDVAGIVVAMGEADAVVVRPDRRMNDLDIARAERGEVGARHVGQRGIGLEGFDARRRITFLEIKRGKPHVRAAIENNGRGMRGAKSVEVVAEKLADLVVEAVQVGVAQDLAVDDQQAGLTARPRRYARRHLGRKLKQWLSQHDASKNMERKMLDTRA